MPIQCVDVWPVCILRCCGLSNTQSVFLLELMMCMINNNDVFNSISQNKCLQSESYIECMLGPCVWPCFLFYTIHLIFVVVLLCFSVTNCDENYMYFEIIIEFTLESLNSHKWICCSSFSSFPRPQSIHKLMMLMLLVLHITLTYILYLLYSRLCALNFCVCSILFKRLILQHTRRPSHKKCSKVCEMAE